MTSLICWQAIILEVPHRWSPIKLEGEFDHGHLLLADLHRPRLGLRWHTPSQRRFDPATHIARMMADEVGKLAAEEARPFAPPGDWEAGSLYTEPAPPGRDLWIGYSRASKRIIQISHHAHRRERILRDTILPTLADVPENDPRPWSMFDLSCEVPRSMELQSKLLNVGDLTLEWAQTGRSISLRQVAVAELALKRRTIEQWLALQQRAARKHYRPAAIAEAVQIIAGDRTLSGVQRRLRRRRRFALLRRLPVETAVMALHDADRDRLILLHGGPPGLLEEVSASIAFAETVPGQSRKWTE